MYRMATDSSSSRSAASPSAISTSFGLSAIIDAGGVGMYSTATFRNVIGESSSATGVKGQGVKSGHLFCHVR